MSDELTPLPKPTYLRIAGGLLVFSTLCQIYFFTILNGIFTKDFDAMGVIEAIIEWIYLVGPSFSLAVFSYGFAIVCTLVSHFRKETMGQVQLWVWGYCVVDIVTFMLITQFCYGV